MKEARRKKTDEPTPDRTEPACTAERERSEERGEQELEQEEHIETESNGRSKSVEHTERVVTKSAKKPALKVFRFHLFYASKLSALLRKFGFK